MNAAPHVFGVRHLSPLGAWHVRAFLDRIQPRAVLIEGPCDASTLFDDIVSSASVPPIALLAYTAELPARSILYPFARYSPEYQAALWAKKNRAECRFIDLPSDVFLALEDKKEERIRARLAEPDKEGDEPESETEKDPPDRVSVYEFFAKRSGEPCYESWWERRFENDTSENSYRDAALEFGAGLREYGSGRGDWAENLVREAWMRREVQATIASGIPADQIVVICGAFHAPVLNGEQPPMTDEEAARLPRRPSKLTLMPYTYFRLSAQSGYGAGNRAPAYFELIWDCLQEKDLAAVPAEFLARIARHVRRGGTARSTAEVIEGVRLARTLSAFRDSRAPTLSDLEDAAITCLGHGERASIADALARAEVGTAVGRLGEGVSQTSIQDDFAREMRRLKLTDYRVPVAQTLKLDLRENRQVKSVEAAFIDLHRSSFLHRLAALGVPFARRRAVEQDSGTWAESWDLAWTPEAEIALVESVLLGETIETATGYAFQKRLDEAVDIGAAARIIRESCECGMPETMERARQTVQRLSADSAAFPAIAQSAREIATVIRYGSVRKMDAKPLEPLVAELFVQACLNLSHAANGDDQAARQVVAGMTDLHSVTQDLPERVDDDLWIHHLQEVAEADDLNATVSGFACAILLERGQLPEADLVRQVSRRLSPGIPADLGAGWFEGLARRNRHALLARLALWRALDDYLQSLDDPEFLRALVFLRRAFGSFSPQEKRHISENLGEIWQLGADETSEALHAELSETEEATLQNLNEFNFDDL